MNATVSMIIAILFLLADQCCRNSIFTTLLYHQQTDGILMMNTHVFLMQQHSDNILMDSTRSIETPNQDLSMKVAFLIRHI